MHHRRARKPWCPIPLKPPEPRNLQLCSKGFLGYYPRDGWESSAWTMRKGFGTAFECHSFEYFDNNVFEVGLYHEAFGFFREMYEHGVEASGFSVASLVTACDRSYCMLREGLQVHGFVVKIGLICDVFVGTSLLNFYCTYGPVSFARKLFEEMPDRNVVTWTSMIVGYSDYGDLGEALGIYQRMRREGVCCNKSTLAAVISSCGMFGDELLAHQVLGYVVKFGLDTNVSVENSLISMFGGFGCMEAACYVFDHMDQRDTISWNSIIAANAHNGLCEESFRCFYWMRRVHKEINSTTVSTLLTVCGTVDNLKWGKGIHGKIVHALVVLAGLHDNLIIGNALVTMYGKSGMMVDAKKVFQKMPKRDEVTWNALIGGHSGNEEPNEAVAAFKSMREDGVPANYITIVNVLGACLTLDNLQKHGMPIHAHIVQIGYESDKYVQNSLITMYAKCGDLNSSNYIFDHLAFKNSIAWNAVIAANSYYGHGEEALKLFAKMRCAGVDLDQFSFSLALAVSADLAILEEGQQLHSLVIKLGFKSDHYVINTTMDMYGKCGEMDDVLKLLPLPISRSRLSWNILISAFARQGCFQKATETFHEMLELGVKPDHVTFVSLLSACSHGGLVDEGLAYYASMTTQYGVPAGIEHCVCIIDLLGRSGRLAEAETFIKQMPVAANDLVWRSLLAACKIHGNVELAKKAAGNLLE
ncbi:pentatricopeptide repeat-containing protein At3g24000, mitochondrial [Fagus crenata]